MKKKNRKSFSLVEVMVAVAIFSIAATALTIGVANGLLCRYGVINHRPSFFKYAFALHVARNLPSISDATGISSLTLPSGETMQVKAAIVPAGADNLFLLTLTVDGNQCETFLANGNWQ
ncbi:MAG: prepilin-type N-terminal cleavage/methylation domain-containing protein [Puniceicoccales bacterium]|nr:prepilin-type N-terminal cleavage/methylation domain-containing protein [Puniceicoccales bacterium]